MTYHCLLIAACPRGLSEKVAQNHRKDEIHHAEIYGNDENNDNNDRRGCNCLFSVRKGDFSQFRAHVLKELDAFAIASSDVPLDVDLKHNNSLLVYHEGILVTTEGCLWLPARICLPQGTMCFNSSRPGGIRTPITRIWSPVLYRSSYWPTVLRFPNSAACCVQLPRLPVKLMLATKAAVFLELESLRGAPFIFRCRVVAASAFDTRQSNQIPHGCSLRHLQVHPTLSRLKATPGYRLRRLLLPSDHPPVSQTVTLSPTLSA